MHIFYHSLAYNCQTKQFVLLKSITPLRLTPPLEMLGWIQTSIVLLISPRAIFPVIKVLMTECLTHKVQAYLYDFAVLFAAHVLHDPAAVLESVAINLQFKDLDVYPLSQVTQPSTYFFAGTQETAQIWDPRFTFLRKSWEEYEKAEARPSCTP